MPSYFKSMEPRRTAVLCRATEFGPKSSGTFVSGSPSSEEVDLLERSGHGRATLRAHMERRSCPAGALVVSQSGFLFVVVCAGAPACVFIPAVVLVVV